jgi:DNA-directed RNA polymerase specialized sigma24 family protein
MTGFHDLYESYSRDVYRFALYLSGDPALADDITSETFVRVWSSPVEYDETIALVARNPDGCRDLPDAAPAVIPV